MPTPLIPVLNVGSNDAHLAAAALDASHRLGGQMDTPLIVSHVESQDMDTVSFAAGRAFKSVTLLPLGDDWAGRPWPAPQNHAWQQVARHIAAKKPGNWFWWEPDACPLRIGWLGIIAARFNSSAKSFAGVQLNWNGTNYMNGVGVWPVHIHDALINSNALYTFTLPFDVAAGPAVMGNFHRLNDIMLHDKKQRGGGDGRSFTETDYQKLLTDNPRAVFYHGCTDGTLHVLVGCKPKVAVAAETEPTLA